MENHRENPSSDPFDGKITTFASPTVLAAILDDNHTDHGSHSMVDASKLGQNSAMVEDSWDASLNDSLEATQLRGISELGGLDQVDTKEEPRCLFTNYSKLAVSETVEEWSNHPKSSTPIQKPSKTKGRTADKVPKPRRSQHIIEKNKEKAGKRSPTKSSYAQMHAIKARNKLKEMEKTTKIQEQNTEGISFVSDVGNNLGNKELINNGDFNQDSYSRFEQRHNLNGKRQELEGREFNLLDDSYFSGLLNASHDHGPYYNVNANYSIYEEGYASDPVLCDGGYQSAVPRMIQSYAFVGPMGRLHHNNLSTQSAPPGVYGYEREPLITSLHHFNEDFYLSSVLPNSDFVNSGHREKFPKSSLHRKFSSDPHLGQSSSPSSQTPANVQRNIKPSGSCGSLQPAFPYKPYTLKDYQTFMGSKVKPLSGGLGPNVDTDDYKEKIKKVSKQREYATMLRAQHSTLKKQQELKGHTAPAAKSRQLKEAEMKRQAALNYAKNVPKPKQLARKKAYKSGPNTADKVADDQEFTVLEILRLRHEQEKKEVDSIRKDLASKLRL